MSGKSEVSSTEKEGCGMVVVKVPAMLSDRVEVKRGMDAWEVTFS